MVTKIIIFDFDGVIADSFDCVFPLIRDGMQHIGLSLTEEQYRNFFIGNVHQGFKDFINDEEKYARFAKFRKDNFDTYYVPKIFPGVHDTLVLLKQKYTLTIASSGNRDTIIRILKENSLDSFFKLVLATTEHSKENMLQEILTTCNAKPTETLMITDTVGDIAVAKKVGLQTMAVTWGFQTKETLASANPDSIVSSFSQISSQNY